MPLLRTARLVLRPKELGDLDAIHAIASEWEVVRWTASWPWPPDRDFTAVRIGGEQPEQGMFATVLLQGRVIGMASVYEGEIGYMLDPTYWGQGYATEACEALIDLAFRTTNWSEIRAGVFCGNDASLRVLDKLGFMRTGESVSFCRALGREVRGVELALPRETWTPGGVARP